MKDGDQPMYAFMQGIPLGKTLDVGCGDGSFAQGLVLDKKSYVGLDSNEKALAIANKKGFKVQVFDVDKGNLPFPDNAFDTIILKDVLEHVNDPEHLMKEARRCIKKNGTLFISTPSEWSQLLWDDYTHKRAFTLRALKQLVGDYGFKVEKTTNYRHTIQFKTSRLKYTGRLLFKFLTGVDLLTQAYLLKASTK